MGDEDRPPLDEAISAALARARVTFPTLQPIDARLTSALLARVRDQPDPLAALGSLAVDEVVLADACALGDPGALAVLEEQYLPDVRATLARVGVRGADVDEAEQLLRAELLVPAAGRGARIAGYAGRSHLRGYLRAVAARIGLRLKKRGRGEEALEEEAPAISADDPELVYLKKTYGAEFGAAFRVALEGLPRADRLLLSQRIVHGMSLADLGALHGVHLSTMSRRVSEARERLVEATHDEMMRRLGVGRSEVSSLIRLVRSQVDITLSAAGPHEDLP